MKIPLSELPPAEGRVAAALPESNLRICPACGRNQVEATRMNVNTTEGYQKFTESRSSALKVGATWCTRCEATCIRITANGKKLYFSTIPTWSRA